MERSRDEDPPETSDGKKEISGVKDKGNSPISKEYPILTLLDLGEKDFLPSHLCSSKIETTIPSEKSMADIEGKEAESIVCPTEILIDIEEQDPVPSWKKKFPVLQSSTVMADMQDKGNKYIQKKEYESILDMSPLSLEYECKERDLKPLANPKQVSGEAQTDCPTDILIDVPIISTKENSPIPCAFSSVKNKLSPPALRWKPPSPVSMCRISKEASKVIQDINSSKLLDEDHLLSEEVMPVPMSLNFDENSDDDDEGLLNQKPLGGILGEVDVISSEASKIDLKSSDVKVACISPKDKSLIQSCLEIGDSKIEHEEHKCITTSEPELQSSSFDNSEVFASDEDTTLFIEKNMPLKENMQEKKDNVLSSKEVIKKNSKVPQRKSWSVKGTDKCLTQENIFDVKNISSRYLPGIKKMQSPEKQKLKKTVSAEPQMPKGTSRIKYSKSLQHGTRTIMRFQEPESVKPKPSMLPKTKSSSADIKAPLTEMKTPAKSSYSVSTSSQKRSISKPILTPRIPQTSVSRFMPQAISGNRLSFSKSLQQPDTSASSSKACEIQGSRLTSTTSKKRFASKMNLPSTLPAEQERNLARALFPKKPPFK